MGVLFRPEENNLGNIVTGHMGLIFMISHFAPVAEA
jgi:hypothetical protein